MNSNAELNEISELAFAGLPLASGLRALSEESPSQRMRTTLIALSTDLESGEELSVVVDRHLTSLPTHMQGMIRSGIDTGNLPRILEQYLAFARIRSESRRHLVLAAGYPAVLLLVSLLIAVLMLKLVVIPVAELFEQFALQLPPITQLVVGWATVVNDAGVWGAVLIVAVIPLLWIGVGSIVGRPARQRSLNSLPIVGAMQRFSALAQFCQLLAILVENHATLPEGLRVAGTATGDKYLEEGSKLLATKIERGISLAEAAGSLPHFPASLQNLFRWEERGDAFPEALRAAGEVFTARDRAHTVFVTALLEPVIIIGTGLMIGIIVLAMFFPMVVLVNSLS